jgi:acylaminoacyl-peptidase
MRPTCTHLALSSAARPDQRWILSTLLLIAVLIPGMFSEALAQRPSLKPQDIFDLEYAEDPQISPDGRKVVYVRKYSDIMKDRRYSNLWIVDFDGGHHRPLTAGTHTDHSPRWSPDGTRVAYISDRDELPQIYLHWLDTGLTSKLTNLELAPSAPSWSPDGKQVAFLSPVKYDPPSITTLPPPPEGAEWAEPAKVIDRVFYRFDDAGYLPHAFTHLFVVPAEGGTPRQISAGKYHHSGLFGGEAPVWTPDGKHLLIAANRRDDFEYEPLDTEIYEFSLADGSMRALTHRRGPDHSPAVSPDGKQIAYVGFDDRYQGYQVSRLYVMNRDGSGSRALSADLDRTVWKPVWSPRGESIAFMYVDKGNTKLATLSLEGEITELTGNLGSSRMAYDDGKAFSVAGNGNVSFTYTRPHVPGDVAATSLDGGAVRVLTSINEDLLSQRKLGDVEEIWYESSHDGRKIHGWIIKPPDFDPSRKYPLILEIHGGPFAEYGDRFDESKQIYAAKGYVVLYTNPRGSTSYGEEFGNLIHHAYPGDDFHDLNSGVDAVIERGFVDPDNVFVTGGSGGGVLTCWMIGHTPRFRAAATLYPVIDWSSWILTSDLPSFGTKYWFPGNPWDHPEHYESRSLLSVMNKVRTPTVVITGEEDYRTPMS